MGKIIYTDRNQRELKQHGTAEFPFRISEEKILEYENKRFNCHWHKEIELAVVFEGKMVYKANEKEYIIETGDCLFVNANALHMGWSIGDQPCVYHAITMDPSICCPSGSELWEKYVGSILECTSLTSILFREDNDWNSEFISKIKEADQLYQQKGPCYEFLIKSAVLKAWSILYRHYRAYLKQENPQNKNVDLLKVILNFIHQNYAKKISLSNIAQAANISKSECSHFFKEYMHESPFEYLLRYRIDRSLPLLRNRTITEAALSVGFSNSSYYTEIFKRYKGVPPRDYIKSNRIERP
ncbi:AraC family transcriptional regulator [Caproicibacter sp.]|uniref:AraC family transcriptional regulator n=1 Tax=Caproicibacter sp. TaxID=2814884 RepID=UPI003989CD68